ncbi:hypothetical protein B7494_g6797 [Chlorociboria aeruginascens]|nr:hypothetical protein B7494_g6797 [Chlorociboria aeruginascens]
MDNSTPPPNSLSKANPTKPRFSMRLALKRSLSTSKPTVTTRGALKRSLSASKPTVAAKKARTSKPTVTTRGALKRSLSASKPTVAAEKARTSKPTVTTRGALKRSLLASKPIVVAEKSNVMHAVGLEVGDEYTGDDERSGNESAGGGDSDDEEAKPDAYTRWHRAYKQKQKERAKREAEKLKMEKAAKENFWEQHKDRYQPPAEFESASECDSHDGLDVEERKRKYYKGTWGYMNEMYDQQDNPSDFRWSEVDMSANGDNDSESESDAYSLDDYEAADNSEYPLFEPGHFAVDYPVDFIGGILRQITFGPEQSNFPAEVITMILKNLENEYNKPHPRIVRAIWDHNKLVWTYRTFEPPNHIPYEYSHGNLFTRNELKRTLKPAPTLGPLEPYQYFNYDHDILVLEYNRCGSSIANKEEYWYAIKTAAKELRRSVQERPHETLMKLHVTYCTYKSIMTVLNQFSKLTTLSMVRLNLHDHGRDYERDLRRILAQYQDDEIKPPGSRSYYDMVLVNPDNDMVGRGFGNYGWKSAKWIDPDEREIIENRRLAWRMP